MELIREHFISNKTFQNSDELFAYAAKLLYEEGYVTADYDKALIKRESEFPTGIKTEINFAIPHAELENVLKSTFMVFVLEKPVEFKSMVDPTELINVKVVILLVLKEKKEHLEFLTKVTSLFKKTDEIKEVLGKDSQKQFEYFARELKV